jgi:cyclin-dependent kinase 12/13
VNNEGILKLADFGLARPWTPEETNYTNRVITLWFRPPELLLGATQYGPAIDMWSAGCILGEMLAKRPLFPGRKELEQLDMIWQVCGTPTKENWPDVTNETKFPLYKMFRPERQQPRVLREKFHNFPKAALDLLDRLLTLDPTKRATAAEALDSDFFWTEPLPCSPEELPKYPSANEFSTKKRPPPNAEHEAKRQRVPEGPPSGQPPHRGGGQPFAQPSAHQVPLFHGPPGHHRPSNNLPPQNFPPSHHRQNIPPQQIPKGPPR